MTNLIDMNLLMKEVIQEELKIYYKAKCDRCGNSDIAIVFSFLEDKKEDDDK